jgi:hypothetical protein
MSSLTLHDIQFLVSSEAQNLTLSHDGIFRLRCEKADIANLRRSVAIFGTVRKAGWPKRFSHGPLNTLSPGEKTCFSLSCKVPRGESARVDGIVIGRRSYVGLFDSQWRISKVALPEGKS